MVIVLIGLGLILSFKLLLRKPQTLQVEKMQTELASKQPEVSAQGKFCGGKNNITCPEKYECTAYGNFPETRGTCQLKQ